MRWQLAALAVFSTLRVVAAASLGLLVLCWRGEYDEDRCCGKGDPSCWDAVFTEDLCCPKRGTEARGGNPLCWVDGYSFDLCCGENPKRDCWDRDFTPERCCTEQGDAEPAHWTDEPVGDAVARRMAGTEDLPLGCRGPGECPEGFWRMVKIASTHMNVSRMHGMPGESLGDEDISDILLYVLPWLDGRRAWEACKAACPIGALNAIDLIGPAVDRQLGLEQAKQLYRLHLELRAELPPGSGSIEPGGWPLLHDSLPQVPRLLDLEPHQRHDCHKTDLLIYAYRLPKLEHMTQPVLACAQKMPQCSASVHIHRWLEAGSCLTDDAEAADLFYLPAYEACYNETACGFGEHTERCFAQDFDPSVDLPHFGRRQGADHVFVFGCNLLGFSDPIMQKARHSVMVTVESYQTQNSDGPDMMAWLSHWKDVVIPGYMPPWRTAAMLAFNKPMLQRRALLAFHGHSSRHSKVGHMYKRSPLAGVRDRIIDHFWNVSGTTVGPPVRDYFRRMGLSRFCLVPAGLTAWTIHLYEAFFFGCVPVILSDELTVPFQDKVDWPSLSLKVPSSIDMDELHAKLSNFSMGRLKAMHRGLAAARCWFDYAQGWGEEGKKADGCSPYRGLLDALQNRARRGPSLYSLPRYWEPPPRT